MIMDIKGLDQMVRQSKCLAGKHIYYNIITKEAWSASKQYPDPDVIDCGQLSGQEGISDIRDRIEDAVGWRRARKNRIDRW